MTGDKNRFFFRRRIWK